MSEERVGRGGCVEERGDKGGQEVRDGFSGKGYMRRVLVARERVERGENEQGMVFSGEG